MLHSTINTTATALKYLWANGLPAKARPTTNLNAALGDAAWMTGMERNADLIIMSCYAPLFVNVNTATSHSAQSLAMGF
jgi:hypothetical protein